MNNTLEGINSRITETEEQINDLENRKNEKNWRQRDLWDNIKHVNICIIGDLEGEKRKKAHEKIFEEILAENVLNMGKEIVNQVEEA